MYKLYNHWPKVGIVIAILLVLSVIIFHQHIDTFRIILIFSFVTLCIHQIEEYQLPGGFVVMVNRAMFKSRHPKDYPLNQRTAFIVNVIIGWGSYALAIIFGTSAVWLAVATILVLVGNFLAHTFMFNIRGKTIYNPGMATAVCIFLPFSIYFFVYGSQHGLFTAWNLVIGIVIGVLLNYFGVIRIITLLADKKRR